MTTSPRNRKSPSRISSCKAAGLPYWGEKRDQPVLLTPPPKMSEQEEELFAAYDFTELDYLYTERIRQRKPTTTEGREKILKHDDIERRLANDPQAVLREAHEAIDHG